MTETSAPVERPRLDGNVLGELRASVRGPVHGPEDVGIVTELAGFDLAVEHAPLAVVGATCVEDVAASVRWAAARGVPVSVLATGHGSWSHRGGVVITLRRLDSVVVDPVARTATVGGGARWAGVVDAAAIHGLAGLSGSSAGVGVVGHTLGGGVSPVRAGPGRAAAAARPQAASRLTFSAWSIIGTWRGRRPKAIAR